MTKGEFVNKYKKRFGCKSCADICWCEICSALDLVWEEMIKECEKRLKTLRKLGH